MRDITGSDDVNIWGSCSGGITTSAFLAHLAADTVAHNYFVPYQTVVSFHRSRTRHAYWELRYEQGQLRARMARLDPDAAGVPADLPRQTGATAFVPLSSLKR